MVLKSREGRAPNPRFWADFLAILTQLYPEATLDRQKLNQLYELVLEQWRNGVQIHLIARQLCSCDGKEIVPSPAAQAHLMRMRGLALPPKDAVPGVPFGPESLEAPSDVAKIQKRLVQISDRIERGTRGMEVLAARASRSSGSRREEILQTLSDAKLALDALSAERLQLASQLEALTQGKPYRAKTTGVLEATRPRAPKQPEARVPVGKADSPTADPKILRKLLLDGKAVLLNKKAFGLPTINDVVSADLGFGFRGGSTASGSKFSFQTAEGMTPIGGGLAYTVISGDSSEVPFKDGSVGYNLAGALASVTAAVESAQLPPKGQAPAPRKPKETKQKPEPKPKVKKERKPRTPKASKNTATPAAPPELPPAADQSPAPEAPLPDDLVDSLINDLAGKS